MILEKVGGQWAAQKYNLEHGEEDKAGIFPYPSDMVYIALKQYGKTLVAWDVSPNLKECMILATYLVHPGQNCPQVLIEKMAETYPLGRIPIFIEPGMRLTKNFHVMYHPHALTRYFPKDSPVLALLYDLVFGDDFLATYTELSENGLIDEKLKKLLGEEGDTVALASMIHVPTFKQKTGLEVDGDLWPLPEKMTEFKLGGVYL